MTEHIDQLSNINKFLPLKEKLISTHKSINDIFPFIVRIAIALYDSKTKSLNTYLHSSGDANPLEHYQTPLENAPSLKKILDLGLPRVVNNLITFDDGEHEHTRRIGRSGYAASYTLPIFNDGEFIGFIFFNSNKKDVFTEDVLRQVDVYAHMISLLVINELSSIQVLTAAVKTTGHITHMRDPETGSHLDRMSRYSRLIANTLAQEYRLDDSYIEHIFMFSPLHDIGKIGIPDNILLKQGKLDEAENKIMKTHVEKGCEIIDGLLQNFGLQGFAHMDVLRNITMSHHEAVNGTGYPAGLKGNEIPLESRIVAVADVFDALTSKRPYKDAWSNEKAINMLKELSGEKLDKACVNALLDNMEQVEIIQQRFKEDNM